MFMKKESRFVISLGCIMLLVLVVLNVGFVFSATAVPGDLNGDGKVDAEDEAYKYGMDLNEFLKKSPNFQKRILEKHLDSFMKGLSKDGKGTDKILELWFKKDDEDKSLLGDEMKNKLWQSFVKSENTDSNEYLMKIANKLFDEKYKDMKWKDPSKVGIKEVVLENPENLIWKGNKIGLTDDEGNLKLWIDLENIPRWMTKIKFDGEKFDLEFNTGYGTKKVKINGGSIGLSGELIGPNGKVIGVHMGEGIKSIIYNNEKKQFEIKYDFDGKEETLTLSEKDLPKEIRKNLMGFVNAGGVVGDEIRKALGNLDGMGVNFRDNEGGVAAQNVLNVLYGGNKDKAEVIEVEYDDKGNPEIRVSDGGTIVTINSQGQVERTYTHWATEGDEDYTKDEKGIFRFSSSGEIKAAQNAILDVVGFGQTHFSRDELIGVDIIRNSLVDAVLRGDEKAILEAVFKKGAGIVEELGLSLSLQELQQEGYKLSLDGTNLQKVQIQLMDILTRELKDENLKIEYKTKIQDALNILTSNLEQSGSNLIESMLSGVGGSLTDEQRADLIEGPRKLAIEELESAMGQILSNPDEIKKLLISQKEGATNEYIKAYLKSRINPNLQTPGANEILDFISKTRAEFGLEPGMTSEELETKINGFIDSPNYHKMIAEAIEKVGDSSAGSSTLEADINTALKNFFNSQNVLANTPSGDKESMAGAIAGLVSEANGKIQEERRSLQQRLKDDFRIREEGVEYKPEYENRVVIDTYLNEVYVKSDKVVIFDSDIPLNEFRAESTRKEGDHTESVIQLWSRGNKVATFDGEKTRVERIGGQRDYASIERIVNGRTGDVLKLGTDSYGYSLYDPLKLVHKSSGLLSIGWRRAHSILQTTVMGPLEGDIAANPDSSVTMTVGGSTLISRLIMKFAGGIPVSPHESAIKNGIDFIIQGLRDMAGGEQKLNGRFNQIDGWISQIEETGAEVPQIITDTYYVSKNLRELDQLANFIGNTQNLQSGSQVVFTGTYISIDGRKLEVNPAIHRSVLRAVAANPVNRHWNFRQAIGIKKQGGPQKGDLF